VPELGYGYGVNRRDCRFYALRTLPLFSNINRIQMKSRKRFQKERSTAGSLSYAPTSVNDKEIVVDAEMEGIERMLKFPYSK